MCNLRQLRLGAFFSLCLLANASQAVPMVLTPQTIALPASAGAPLFADLDGDGLADLLVIDPVAKTLLIHRQHADGFSASPDQTMALPKQTSWATVADVDAHPGPELLFSTTTGLVYARQNGGVFETEFHTLIAANQVFTNFDVPVLAAPSTNDSIPVISAGQTVIYRRNSSYEWSPEPALALEVKQTTWRSAPDEWTLGSSPAHYLLARQTFGVKLTNALDKEPENEAVKKISDEIKHDSLMGYSRTNRLDVNGDGREDLVLWRVSGRLDFKTDIYIFLRGADQKLPPQPSQILHCSGFPIPTGSTHEPSPFVDLNGDGVCELVLLELKNSISTPSGMLDTALTHGIDWSLTVRTFSHGMFSRSADASLAVTAILPSGELEDWPLFIKGDFNGDGRPDLVVRRNDTQWNIFCSTADGSWFAPQPAMTFEAPRNGYVELRELRGDGLADIIWHEPNKAGVTIFMSPPRPTKGKNP